MRRTARLLTVALLASAVACLLAAGKGTTADEEPKPLKPEVRTAAFKLADAVEKKDTDETKKQADALRKEDIAEFMRVFQLRSRNGLGVGATPGDVTPDGILDPIAGSL